ncbi:MAG: nickel-dependent hydrogenase large subunit [Paracoccaceae bacterium]
MASVRSVEDALKISAGRRTRTIRNLMIAAQYVHDHVMHFYHLHALDWVDVVSALDAGPGGDGGASQVRSSYPEVEPRLLRRREAEAQGLRRTGPLASSRTATGATRATSCRRKPT